MVGLVSFGQVVFSLDFFIFNSADGEADDVHVWSAKECRRGKRGYISGNGDVLRITG